MLYPLKLAVLTLLVTPLVQALGDDQCILFPEPHHQPSYLSIPKAALQTLFGRSDYHQSDSFIIADKTHNYAPPLLLDSEDDEAIHIAAHSFIEDIERVTGVKIGVYNDTLPRGVKRGIVVGSVGSRVVKGDWTKGMKGRWEVWDARVVSGYKGLEEALVLSGSDRVSPLRGEWGNPQWVMEKPC
jgi:hypothetical protein